MAVRWVRTTAARGARGFRLPPVTQNTKIVGSFGLGSILLTQGRRADLEVISLIIVGWPLFSNRGREGATGYLRHLWGLWLVLEVMNLTGDEKFQ